MLYYTQNPKILYSKKLHIYSVNLHNIANNDYFYAHQR